MYHHHHREYVAALTDERVASRRRVSRRRDLGELVEAATAGDRRAWTAIVEQFTARVRRVARSCSLAPHDVDDVEPATWMRLLEGIGSIHNPAALGAWLETTARRESLRAIGRNARERPVDEDLLVNEPVEPVAESRVVASERRAAVNAALERLPVHQRQLLTLLVSEPSPLYGEISSSLKMPIGSIGPTRARAIARLRRDRELAGAVG
jgi:RNA polymerase sigma factor (sigma-70 family)